MWRDIGLKPRDAVAREMAAAGWLCPEDARALLARAEAMREAAAQADEAFTMADHQAHDIRTGIFPKQSPQGVATAAGIRALPLPEPQEPPQ